MRSFTKTIGRARDNARERGAALLVVMLILLMTTGTAMFAIHTTSYEVRASGHSTRAMQVQQMARGGIDMAIAQGHQMSFQALYKAAEQNPGNVSLANMFEPDFTPTMTGVHHRFGRATTAGTPWPDQLVAPGDAFGPRNAYTPDLGVDMFMHAYNGPIPGCDDSAGEICAFVLTLSSRARSRLTAGDYQSTTVQNDRQFHEIAADARGAYIVSRDGY